jgi:UDP-glucose 4-epimerase|tara:strand:- start:1597 stop:2493 length:897 start_codon:yes stop_codon:yes gene_type:complete
MKYLVTGGAGFIGSHIVDSLVEHDHHVVVIDNESAENHDFFYWNDKAENHKVDICDHEKIQSLFDGVDTVFHCAAEARMQPAIFNPLLAIKTNTLGTCSVLQAARENKVRRFVYSSTSSAYGHNDVPNIETQSDNCLNPYSVSKVSGEKLCKMYYDLFGLETVILRYFNAYGDRQPTKGQYATVVGKFLSQKQRGEPLTIVPDGSQKRDYTHVSDIVGANILSSTVKMKNYGEVFNVGSGKNISVNELAKLISDNKILIEPRIGESKLTLANVSKIKTIMGWSPKVSLSDWISNKLNA